MCGLSIILSPGRSKHQSHDVTMEMLSTLLALCDGNPLVDSSDKGHIVQSLDEFIVVGLNMLLTEQWRWQLFKSLWSSDAIWHMVTKNWVNIGSSNGLVPDCTKPLPEPMLTYHQ